MSSDVIRVGGCCCIGSGSGGGFPSVCCPTTPLPATLCVTIDGGGWLDGSYTLEWSSQSTITSEEGDCPPYDPENEFAWWSDWFGPPDGFGDATPNRLMFGIYTCAIYLVTRFPRDCVEPGYLHVFTPLGAGPTAITCEPLLGSWEGVSIPGTAGPLPPYTGNVYISECA